MAQTITDLKISLTDKGYYDLPISGGDFESTSGFESAILMSLLTDARADGAEMSPPQKRRGWIGNEMGDIEGLNTGSKLWLLSQARLTQDTVNKAVDFARTALQWFIDDDYSDRISVSGVIKNNGLILTIILYDKNDIIAKLGYDIWRQTIING